MEPYTTGHGGTWTRFQSHSNVSPGTKLGLPSPSPLALGKLGQALGVR